MFRIDVQDKLTKARDSFRCFWAEYIGHMELADGTRLNAILIGTLSEAQLILDNYLTDAEQKLVNSCSI
ncbi:MAG: hypothetical protein PHS44_03160 [Candidatus Dojkabacteria bacterium]|jgi:hypothetical protein|nr:hypothetical protein [Candidatus Dojkabacteria bacterium]